MNKGFVLPAVALISFFMSSCLKEVPNDLSGDKSISGILFLEDTLTGSYAKSLVANTAVSLSYTDSVYYLYTVTTDDKGRFVFNGLDEKRTYTVSANSSSNNIRYDVSRNYQPGSLRTQPTGDTLVMRHSQKNQNGLFIHAYDSMYGSLPKCKLYVFSSRVLFNSNDLSGAVYTLDTDDFGRLLIMNLIPGTYYIKARATYGSLLLKEDASALIEKEGIKIVSPLVLR